MDPISDMLVRIQNGYRARKPVVVLPASSLKQRLAEVLAKRKFIAEVEKKGRKARKFLELTLRYNGSEPALKGFRRRSKPSRRVYLRSSAIRPVLQGYGALIISTSQGLMTGEEAKKQGLGGEAICEVW